jgi:hypothetical protein
MTLSSGLSQKKATSDSLVDPSVDPFEVRVLVPEDIDRLMVLEKTKWTADQATTGEEMLRRIAAYPRTSIGAFSRVTGEALVSLFVKPVTAQRLAAADTWADCAQIELPLPRDTSLAFGISLSSVDADAVPAVLGFACSRLLESGFTHVYLGSPLPGLRAWRSAHPDTPVAEYVFATHDGIPRDPQLRYYYGKGFSSVESCKPDYFPHEESLDYGAVIRGDLRDILESCS